MSYESDLKRFAYDVCKEINDIEINGEPPEIIFPLPLVENNIDLLLIKNIFFERKVELEKIFIENHRRGAEIYTKTEEVFDKIELYLSRAGHLFVAADAIVDAMQVIAPERLLDTVVFGPRTLEALLARQDSPRGYLDFAHLVASVLKMESMKARGEEANAYLFELLERFEILCLIAEADYEETLRKRELRRAVMAINI